MGPHRLGVGDATNPDDVAELMGGERADMVFTDPPYGLGKKIKNDGKRGIMDLHRKWIPISFDCLKDFSSWYFWNADELLMRAYVEIIMPLMSKYNLHFKNLIVWNKGPSPGMGAPGQRMYAPGHECCLFLTRGNDEYPVDAGAFYGGFEEIRKYISENIKAIGGGGVANEAMRNQMASHYMSRSQWRAPSEKDYNALKVAGEAVGAFPLAWEEFSAWLEKPKKELEKKRSEFMESRRYFDNEWEKFTDVWSYPVPFTGSAERKDAGGFPCIKPLAVCEHALKTSCPPYGLVVDLFGGSGSTLIAAMRQKRKCYMLELDPAQAEKIVDRYNRNTGGLFD